MSRRGLRAYLKLQECHRELHRTLKCLEQDALDEEVHRRINGVQEELEEAKRLLGLKKRSLKVLEETAS